MAFIFAAPAKQINHKMMQWFYLATATVLGAIIGSFLNVVIHRGPGMWGLAPNASPRGNLAAPRSYCPSCGAQIRIINLIPVVSYLLLGGKCAACQAVISPRYLIVELLGACAGLIAILLFGLAWQALAAAVFFWLLIALAVIDWETGYLPDALTLPLIAIGLGVNLTGFTTTPLNALIGAVAGYAVFRIVGAAFFHFRKIEGMGQGDAKLLAAIGAWLGWQALAPVVFIGSMLALIGVGIMQAFGGSISKQTPIPFGPALAVSAAILLMMSKTYHGAQALSWILPAYP